MGCEIHLHAEKRNLDGTWSYIQSNHGSFYDGRNYFLFAILADVRNNRELRPIDFPRGIPKDISQTTERHYAAKDPSTWRPFAPTGSRTNYHHSASFFSLSEICEYDWDQTFEMQKFLSLKGYRKWDKKTVPIEPYEDSLNISNAMHIEMYEADEMISSNLVDVTEVMEENYAVIARWQATYRAWCSDFLNSLKMIMDCAAGSSPEDIRIIFWFDN